MPRPVKDNDGGMNAFLRQHGKRGRIVAAPKVLTEEQQAQADFNNDIRRRAGRSGSRNTNLDNGDETDAA